MSIQSYRDLLVWQKSMDLVVDVYDSTREFPKHEMYGLTSQIQRASVSIPANVAEGHDRDSTREYLRFVAIAIGSLAELETLIAIAQRLKYLDDAHFQSFQGKCQSLGRMLRNLQRALRARQRRQNDEGRSP